MSIEALAEVIIKQEQAEAEKVGAEKRKLIEQYLKTLENAFENEFCELLPHLRDSGINFHAFMNKEPYPHNGGGISFYLDGLSCQIEISEDGSWRKDENSTYGRWQVDVLIKHLYTKLIQPREIDPASEAVS